MSQDPSIKIIVCYHKPDYLFQNSILEPVHLGRALAKKRGDPPSMLDGLLGDDTGDNISELNSKFCEMTGLYWAWRNYDALGNPDYCGLMHYRRLLDFTNKAQGVLQLASHEQLDKRSIEPETIRSVVSSSDICVKTPIGIFQDQQGKERRHFTVMEQYLGMHSDSYLIDAFEIAAATYPEFARDVEAYSGSFAHYLCNIAIMRRNLFLDYAKWMFSILLPMERRIKYNRPGQSIRCISYLSERLTGLYITHLKRTTKLKITELPSINIGCW